MNDVKTIVCLANSKQPGGRCLVGKEIGSKKWIRLVTTPESGAVKPYTKQNNESIKVKDIFDAELVVNCPIQHQHENWLINPNKFKNYLRMQELRFMETSQLNEFTDEPNLLWNGSESDIVNDRIKLIDVEKLRISESLFFICVDEVTIVMAHKYRKQLRAIFNYKSINYNLSVTDLVYRQKHSETPIGHEEKLSKCYLTVSLGLSYKGDCYKLVAAIIECGAIEQQ